MAMRMPMRQRQVRNRLMAWVPKSARRRPVIRGSETQISTAGLISSVFCNNTRTPFIEYQKHRTSDFARTKMITTKHWLAATFLLLGTNSIRADDWPQWQGPKRDGVWRES